MTISGSYGAGGGVVAPRVAERLGVTFWDRAIPASVAADLAERPEEVLAVEDDLGRGISHWISFFASS
ncbi:MAG: cytidylate kinase family protein [Acidimicrobiales bacterium]